MVSSLSGIFNGNNSKKIFGKKSAGTTPVTTPSIWSNYINTDNKKQSENNLLVKKQEGVLSSIYSKLKAQVKESKFTEAVMLFLHIKSDKRYQNLSIEEKQKLHEFLKKYNFDINDVEAAKEKINSYLEHYDKKSKKKDRGFAKAMKSAAKFSMGYNYGLMCGNILPGLLLKRIEKNLADDNKLFIAMLDFFSNGMNGEEKAEFIGDSAKNSVAARKEAFKYLEKLIEQNPTTKENIEKLYELNQESSLSVNDMLIKLLDETDCKSVTKSKIKKIINKIKENIPKEFQKYFEDLTKSDAWLLLSESRKVLIEYVKQEISTVEKTVKEQKQDVEKKEEELKIEDKNLDKSKQKAKLMKKQADEIIENIRIKCNLTTIPENHKDDILKNNNILVYNRYKDAQAELKQAKDAEYDAASNLRLAEAFLEIDKKHRDFTIARCNRLLS